VADAVRIPQKAAVSCQLATSQRCALIDKIDNLLSKPKSWKDESGWTQLLETASMRCKDFHSFRKEGLDVNLIFVRARVNLSYRSPNSLLDRPFRYRRYRIPGAAG
jgi:hypothetical protein